LAFLAALRVFGGVLDRDLERLSVIRTRADLRRRFTSRAVR
jgi:hypothetical protein